MNADAKKHAAAFGWFGICAGVAFCFMWLACYGADSSWEWGTNALSDFGVSDTDAATYFEWGCVISAILLAFFGVGEALNDKRKSGYLAAGILLALAGICLIFVGFYDSDYEGGDIHEFFAVLAATLFAFAAASWAAQTWYDGKVIVAGAAVVLFCVSLFSAFGFAEEEWEVISIVAGLVWLFIAASYTIGVNVQPKNPVSAIGKEAVE